MPDTKSVTRDIPETCFINNTADFSDFDEIKCIIKIFPDDESHTKYGIRRTDDGKNTTKKAYKISGLKFVLKRYWYFALALILLLLICLFVMPSFMIVSYSLFAGAIVFYKPFESRKKIRMFNRFFYLLSIIVAVSSFVLLFNTNSYGEAVHTTQGLFYSILTSYGLFFYLGLYFKYKDIFALDIDNADDWYEARYFVWKGTI